MTDVAPALLLTTANLDAARAERLGFVNVLAEPGRGRLLKTDDFKEGIGAFLERRLAHWTST